MVTLPCLTFAWVIAAPAPAAADAWRTLEQLAQSADVGAGILDVQQQARVVPAFTDGKIAGFKIFRLADDSLPRSCGMRDGDILKAVNGVALMHPDHFKTAAEKVRADGQAEIDVLRGTEQVRIAIPVAREAPQ